MSSSGHTRTHPDHLDEQASHMHQAASDVEGAAGEFDAHIAGADYGGGDTAQFVHGIVTGVGGAVGGGPEGAGGKVAQHKHQYADNMSTHAANSRQNEADTAAAIDAIAKARTPEAVVAAAEQHLQQKLAAEAARREQPGELPGGPPGAPKPSALDGMINNMVDRSRDVAGTHPNNGPNPDLPTHTVTVQWKPGMPKVQFARKALALRRLGNEGALFKAREPKARTAAGEPDARDKKITADYKGALINIIHANANPELADQSAALARSMQPDHVSELQLGGADSWRNLRMLHGKTNHDVGTAQIRPSIAQLPEGTPIKVKIKWW
ncbi:hypothetical protein [Streptacidiphilus sp. EB129]|uniref:hypothetical protein n=1 Tax=Streptacidiphilus sp. EB129 TaxID=3156262 RepID=UPI0035182709